MKCIYTGKKWLSETRIYHLVEVHGLDEIQPLSLSLVLTHQIFHQKSRSRDFNRDVRHYRLHTGWKGPNGSAIGAQKYSGTAYTNVHFFMSCIEERDG